MTIGQLRALGIRLRYTSGPGLSLDEACRRVLGWSFARRLRP